MQLPEEVKAILMGIMGEREKIMGPKVATLSAAEEADWATIRSRVDILVQQLNDIELLSKQLDLDRRNWWRKTEKAHNLTGKSLRCENGALFEMIEEGGQD